MRKKRIESILILVTLICAVSLAYLLRPKDEGNTAMAAGTKVIRTDIDAKLKKDTTKELGTEDNPFVILEIVPKESYALMGYYVGGQEPIDINVSTDDWGTLDSIKAIERTLIIGSNGANTSIYRNKNLFAKYCIGLAYEDLDRTPLVEKYYFGGWYYNKEGTGQRCDWIGEMNGNITLYAKWVTNESEASPVQSVTQWEKEGIYQVVFDANLPEGIIGDVENMPASITKTGGNINLQAKEFIPSVKTEVEAKIEDYQIKVVTVTPEELNHNLGLIEKADLIAIIPKTYFNDSSYIKLFEKYQNKELFPTEISSSNTFFENDLSWKATVRILERTAIESDSIPLIYDRTYYDSCINSIDEVNSKKVIVEKNFKNGEAFRGEIAACQNNIYKLYLMLHQMDPVEFYQEYISSGRVKEVELKGRKDSLGMTMTTGAFPELEGEAQTYWGSYTFIPYEQGNNYQEIIDYCTENNIDYDMNKIFSAYNVIGNVFSFNGDNTLTFLFASDCIVESYNRVSDAFEWLSTKADGTTEVLSSIRPVDVIYYLLHVGKGETETKDIKILEIQPCADYKTKASWEKYIKTVIPNYTGKITIETQTVDEFVGKVTDLNSEYDLIYFGSNTGTTQNVMAPADYIYYHEGAEVAVTDKLLAWNTDFTYSGIYGGWGYFTRYPGNDITKVKYKEIKEFIAAGYPVIFSSKLFSENQSAINTKYVDTASNIYELLRNRTGTTIFAEGEKDTTKLKNALLKTHCELTLFSKPVAYKDRTLAENASLTDADIYVNGSSSEKELNYQFYITGTSTEDSSKYTVRLYIDTNADGRYDLETESLSGLILEEAITGKSVSANQLESGHVYNLTKKVEEYVGILPWKLEIVQNNNSAYRATAEGMCAIKVETTKERLDVLQITANSSNNVYLPNASDVSEFEKKGYNAQTAGVTEKFWYYTKNLDDFDVHFTRMTVSQFEDAVKNASDPDSILKDYNMLIIGFADCYGGIESTKALQAIEDFIDEGKTTLFTHDTTSYHNTKESGWGYTINQYFRDKLGMDRFGLALMYPGTSQTAQMSVEDVLKKNKDAAYKNGTLQEEVSTYNTILGYNYVTIKRFLQNGAISATQTTTNKVSKVNDGQITKYPYEIPDQFTVATTHAQYYQLDMESDDIVVWYCLDGGENNLYSSSPNNTRNNYYIYNRGNITYSGVGHSGGLTDTEVKLFVNTMIAAYNATAGPLDITITNTDKTTDESGNAFLYVDYDFADNQVAYGEGINLTEEGQTKRIYFKLTEDSIISNKKIYVSYYEDSEEGTKLDLITRTKDGTIVNAKGGLEAGVEYYVDVSIDSLKENNSAKFIISAVMKYGEGLSKEKTAIRSVTIYRRGLFNLN